MFPAPGARRLVEIADERMTLVTQGATVKSVLELLAARADLRIAFHGDAEEVLHAAIEKQPLESGLRSLVETSNLAFFYASRDGAGRRRLREVLILASGRTPTGALLCSARRILWTTVTQV